MKKYLQSFAMCFSMYSRVPMPRVEWAQESMRYVFCFFPLVGALVGGGQLAWYLLAVELHVNPLLYAAVAAVLPILLTGGIHFDGYMDTCDALFSYGDREKKLEIMKDPHTGAFAVIYGCVCLLLTFGLFSQLYVNAVFPMVLAAAAGYVISRCICGLCVVCMECAKTSGLAHMFGSSSDKIPVRIVLSVWLALSFAVVGVISPWTALLAAVLLAIVTTAFAATCRKQFGGITGDLAGFVLQLCELVMLVCAVILF